MDVHRISGPKTYSLGCFFVPDENGANEEFAFHTHRTRALGPQSRTSERRKWRVSLRHYHGLPKASSADPIYPVPNRNCRKITAFSNHKVKNRKLQGDAKGGRQKELDHFFIFGHLSVTFSDAFVSFFVTFLPDPLCWTPFTAG